MNEIKMLSVQEVKDRHPNEYFELYDSIKESGIDENKLNFGIKDTKKIGMISGNDLINQLNSGNPFSDGRKNESVTLLVVWHGEEDSDDYFENFVELNGK